MTAGSEILQYKGDAGLGIGSNASIPVIYTDNNVINQTGRDIMMLNHENNVNLWKQKIADRDKQLAMIDAGQIETGKILEQDKPVVSEMQKKADDALLKYSKTNSKEDAIAYQKAKTQVKDAVTHAQYRWLGRTQLESEKAQQTLDEDKNAYQRHLEEQDKLGFNGDYKPFQKSLDYEADLPSQIGWEGVLGQPTSTTTKQTVKTAPNGQQTVTDVKTQVPVKGGKGAVAAVTPESADVSTTTVKRNGKTYQVTQSQIDFDKIRQNEIKAYADDKGKNFQQLKMHRDIYETAPDAVFEPYMQHIVKRAGDYNADKGLKEGDAGYIDTKKLAQDLGIDPVSGKRTGQKIMLSTPDFAAYTALADYNGSYAPKSESFNKEESEFDLKKGMNDANIFYKYALANAAAKKANAYGRYVGAKINALKPEEQDKFLDDLYKRNLVSQSDLITGAGGTTIRLASIPAQKSLPVFTFDGANPKQLKPIGSKNVVDNTGHIIGYDGGHYNQEYKYGGKTITPQKVADQYQDFKKAAGDNWKGSFNDWLKEAIDNDIYEVKLIGENGSTDMQLSRSAQKAISNKVTKKDQEGVFEAPVEEQAQPE